MTEAAATLSPTIAAHLWSAVAALVLGSLVLARPKGTLGHKYLGRLWVLLMLMVALSSFWILEIRDGQGWSVIHILSAWILISLGLAIWAIRNGKVSMHRRFMVGSMLGLIGAGVGTLWPGRIVGDFFAGLF